MLPSSEHVRAAYLGSEGILSVEPGQLHPHLLVDCSTIDPITSQEVRVGAGRVARLSYFFGSETPPCVA